MNRIKNIILVGAFSDNPEVYTYASSFYQTLIKLGFDVISFNYRAKSLFNIIPALNLKTINNSLIKLSRTKKPDLVFLIKAECITAQTIATIKQTTACKIINFYPDNPFVVWNANSNEEVLKSLPLYDCFLSWSNLLSPTLITAGCRHVCNFPFAYDENLFKYQIMSLAHQNYTADVCFIGSWEPERETWLSMLIQNHPSNNLVIWGNNWYEKTNNVSLKKYIYGPAIYNDSMIKAFQSSKIVLNFIRQQNATSHNMRSFEVPASNSFLLTQRTEEQANVYFKEGKHIECFSSPHELTHKINFYLNHDAARECIKKQGFQHVQQYSLENQLKQYFESSCFLNT